MPDEKKEKKKEKMVEIEKTETMVKYDFSQDELVVIGEQVADIARKLASVEAEAKNVAKQYKADLERLELESARWLEKIRDKYEYRNMETFKVIDGTLKKVFFFRADEVEREYLLNMTAEEFRNNVTDGVMIPEPAKERDARPSELQKELPIGNKAVEVEAGENVEFGDAATLE